MEGIQTINALKAVVSSLPAQTTIPSSELVMLYAADGTPIAKIARDDLVKAVASVIASNSQTTFSKLLGVQANGTPMGIGASDLASVLGAKVITKQADSETIRLCELTNYSDEILFVFGYDKADNRGWSAMIRVHRQSTVLNYYYILSKNSPKLYWTTNAAGNIEIYAQASFTYPRIVASNILYGSSDITMDKAGTDVSGMTQITE
jgi:hypothetical protein